MTDAGDIGEAPPADPAGSARPGSAPPEMITADSLVPRNQVGSDSVTIEWHERLENARDRRVGRFGGIVILCIAIIISGAVILVPSDGSNSERAWNLMFLVVGYAGAYIFRDSGKR